MNRLPLLAILVAALACAGGLATGPQPAGAADAGVNIAIVTNLGTIDAVLDPVHAPITTKNFLRLIDAKFFDGGTFFRAVPSFVIQGGNKTREKDNDPAIPLETPSKTGIKNTDGALSMARTSEPNSATSEFFICDGDQAALDGSGAQPGYAAFGHVTKNMELVRQIARMPAPGQMLTTPVRILRVRRLP
jgi:peptidyl-prolyl cis-trans isomerase A (cyclophilin A)